MRSLILALQFMTRLPLPAVRAEREDMAAAMRWIPASGVLVGGAVAAGMMAGRALDHGGEGWLGAFGGLLAWVGITGALHLDGLGDMADAAGGAHKDRARLSAILADPHIGSFGVVAIALQLLAKLVLLHALSQAQIGGLIVLAVAARMGPLVWTLTLPPLHDGLGAMLGRGLRWWHMAVWALVIAAAATWAPWVVATAPAMIVWRWWIARRIGGISGDGHGAGIEITETILLLALVAWR